MSPVGAFGGLRCVHTWVARWDGSTWSLRGILCSTGYHRTLSPSWWRLPLRWCSALPIWRSFSCRIPPSLRWSWPCSFCRCVCFLKEVLCDKRDDEGENECKLTLRALLISLEKYPANFTVCLEQLTTSRNVHVLRYTADVNYAFLARLFAVVRLWAWRWHDNIVIVVCRFIDLIVRVLYFIVIVFLIVLLFFVYKRI